MCFSAQVSFTAAGVLAAAGAVLVKKFHKDRLILLSLIPVFFAVQQFSEGFVWLSLTHGHYPNFWSGLAQGIYQFFAYIFWPIWVPLAFRYAEKSSWRKSVLNILIFLGTLSIVKVGLSIAHPEGFTAQIVHHSISYKEGSLSLTFLYAFIVLSPFFISSLAKAWIAGVIIGIAFFASHYLYTYAFISVWCFFSAIASLALLFLLKKNARKRG